MTTISSRTSHHPVSIIARKELGESLRDGRFRTLAASILALLLVGLAGGWLETRQARQAIETAEDSERATWLGQGAKNPHSAAHFGNYAFKPRSPLAALDRGVDDYLGRAVWLEAHWQDPFSLRPAEDRTAVQRFGELTAAFTLQVLVPLLLILLGFAAFAGEREDGTLLLLSSLGLKGRTLMLGKALGLGGALSLVLVPATLLGAGAALVGGRGDTSPDSGAMAALFLALVYGAYFVTLLAIVLAVSAKSSNPRSSLVILLGLWMLSTLVSPRLVADLAERLYPIPTPRAFFAAIEADKIDGLTDEGNFQERRQALVEQVLAEYGVKSLEELPVSFAGISLQASEEHSNLVYDKHYGKLWQLYAGQERVHLWAGLVSPRLAVRALSMAVAGTDISRHRHFAQTAESHRRVLVKYLNDDMTHNAGEASFGYRAAEELWHEAPTFEYHPPGIAEVLGHQVPALLLLGAWLLSSIAFAVRATARLQVLPGGAS